MNNITIITITSTDPLYSEVWNLREAILRQPIGLSLKNEDLSQDHNDTFFVALDNNNVIGCLMAQKLDDSVLKLRQMAVYNEWQGKGIGRLLLNTAEEYAGNAGYKKISLHARKSAKEFYDKLGYETIGNEFTEVGIPHYKMIKLLS
jgi:ribosomal protein S18 acetylase RimI-like enzyme